jgi:hypothetical protein
MWRDYVQPVSTIAALTLSTLALVLAQFPIGSTRAKWTYVLIVIFFNLLAAASVVYSQYYTITKAHTETTTKRENRERLGEFINQGNALLARLRDQNAPLADTDSNGWATNVEAFLLSRLGQSYVTRFRSDTGILLGQPTNLAGDHLNYWLGVRNRVYNLERFSAEIPQ